MFAIFFHSRNLRITCKVSVYLGKKKSNTLDVAKYHIIKCMTTELTKSIVIEE